MRPGTDMQALGSLNASFQQMGEVMPGFDAVANVTGMSAAVAKAALPPAVPLVVLTGWLALPLGLAILRFKGREL